MTRRMWWRGLLGITGGGSLLAACGGTRRAPDRPELRGGPEAAGPAPKAPAPKGASSHVSKEAPLLALGFMNLAGFGQAVRRLVSDWNDGKLEGPANRPRLQEQEVPRQPNTSVRDSLALYLVAREVAGKPLDLVWLQASMDFLYLFTRQLFQPIDRFAQSDTTRPLARFSEQALALMRYRRQTFGLPVAVLPAVAVCNEDFFKAAQLPLPKNDWSRDEFITLGKQLTKDRDGNGTIDQWGYAEGSLPGWLPFILQEGGNVVDLDTGKISLTEPAALRGLRFWQDLGRVHGIMPFGQHVDAQALRGTIDAKPRQNAITFGSFATRYGQNLRPVAIPRGKQVATPLGLQEALAIPAGATDGASAYTALVGLGLFLGQDRLVPAVSAAVEFIRKPDASHTQFVMEPQVRDLLLDVLPLSVGTHLASGGELAGLLFSRLSLPLAKGEGSLEQLTPSAAELIKDYLEPKPPPTPAPEKAVK